MQKTPNRVYIALKGYDCTHVIFFLTSDYAAVFYPGGHGPMFDLAYDTDVASITEQVFEAGGVVGAVCHGPAGKREG